MTWDNIDLAQDTLENLEVLETLLLKYEESLKRGEEDTSVVQIMFRYAHNSKGAFGILGCTEPQRAVHTLENALDEVREGKAKLTIALIDAMLSCIGMLNDFLNAPEEEYAFQAIEERMISAQTKVDAQHDKESVSPIYNPELAQLIEAAVQLPGESVYVVEKVITTPITQKEIDQLPIFEDLKAVGTFLTFTPALSLLSQSPGEAVLSIYFRANKSESEIESNIFDPFKLVRSSAANASPVIASNSRPLAVETPGLPNSGERRFLIVEDDFISRRILERILRPYGRSDFAFNGKEGILSYLLGKEESLPYHLIFLDIHMPSVDGLSMLKQIRKAEIEHATGSQDFTPVVMVSSCDEPKTVMDSYKNKCNGYLTKPLNPHRIEEILHRLLK